MNPYKGIPYIARLVLKKEYWERIQLSLSLNRQNDADWYSEQLLLVNEAL